MVVGQTPKRIQLWRIRLRGSSPDKHILPARVPRGIRAALI